MRIAGIVWCAIVFFVLSEIGLGQVRNTEEAATRTANKEETAAATKLQMTEIGKLLGELADNRKEIEGILANAEDEYELHRAALLLMTNRLIEAELNHLSDMLGTYRGALLMGEGGSDDPSVFIIGLRTAYARRSTTQTIKLLDAICPSIKDQPTFAAADRLRNHARDSKRMWELHIEKIAATEAQLKAMNENP